MPNPLPDLPPHPTAPPAPDRPSWDQRAIHRDNIAAGISLALLLLSGIWIGLAIFSTSALSSDGCSGDRGLCSATGQLIVVAFIPVMTLLAWLIFASSYVVRARRGIRAAQVLRWSAWILQVAVWYVSFTLGSSLSN